MVKERVVPERVLMVAMAVFRVETWALVKVPVVPLKLPLKFREVPAAVPKVA